MLFFSGEQSDFSPQPRNQRSIQAEQHSDTRGIVTFTLGWTFGPRLTHNRIGMQQIFIGNWCDSLHVTAFHLRFSPQVLGYNLECSEISHVPLPAAKLFWSSPVPFWVPDMSCVGTSHDNFGAPHKWIGVTCPKHCYLRGFRHLTPFHSKTWIALVASCGDPWSQFLWVAIFRIRDLGRPWEPQNISLNKNPDSCDGNDRFSRDFTAKTKAHRGWEWLRVI